MAAGRILYALTLVLLGTVLFYSGSAMALFSLVLLVAVGLSMWPVLRRDGKMISLVCKIGPGGRVGSPRALVLSLRHPKRLLGAKTLFAEMEITNAMTGDKIYRQLILPLRKNCREYALSVTPENCGELTVRCLRAGIRDHLDLFNRKIENFPTVKTVIYPQNVHIDVLLNANTAGSPRDGGPTQNRRGNDPSEVFDLREYVPGDDIRAIHWKLSVKTDSLVLRQPGAPTYYDLLLLPDIGLMQGGEASDRTERSAAIAYGAGALRDLVRQGIRCCLALPTPEGMTLLPISNRQEYQDALGLWLRTKLPQNAGDGIKRFRSEHLDDQFSRVLLLSAGKLAREQELYGIRSSVAVLSAVAGASGTAAAAGAARVTELPAPPEKNTRCRVAC